MPFASYFLVMLACCHIAISKHSQSDCMKMFLTVIESILLAVETVRIFIHLYIVVMFMMYVLPIEASLLVKSSTRGSWKGDRILERSEIA